MANPDQTPSVVPTLVTQQSRNTPAHLATSDQSGLHKDAKDFEEFVYLLSHDLRASARALADVPKWISEDLADDGFEISDLLAEYFEIMDTHSRRLNRMLIDLLTYSRVGRKQDTRTVKLCHALKQAIEECTPPSKFTIKKDFQCDELEMGTTDVVVLLTAFLSNAIKHNQDPNGKFEISSRLEGGEVALYMCDNGPGIPEKHRESVLDVMTTLRPRDEVEGSGMGLAIVHKIVAFYGGQMQFLEPKNGVGLAVEIRLPALAA